MGSLGFRATFYDIIGYMIPGSLFLLIGWSYGYVMVDAQFAKKVMKFIVTNPGFSLAVIGAMGYICGHAVNALSSFVLEKPFKRWTMSRWQNWISRINSLKLKRADEISQSEFHMPVSELKAFDIRIRMETKLPGPAITGLCFLSYYGMSRNLVALSLMTIPLAWSYAWWLVVLPIMVAYLFWYQYSRFVINYYDFLGSTMLFEP